jgi:glycosyltransferase involved in cell wall biosynthesis
MNVSVIICTWNRAETLKTCLNSFLKIKIPADFDWELLIVDNGSTDSTGEVIEEFKDRLPLKNIIEPRMGLSVARNHGFKEAQGELVLFTDDDVEITPGWMMRYWQTFLRNPDCDFFGAEIIPKSDFSNLSASYLQDSIFDGLVVRKKISFSSPFIQTDDTPFGANMGF